MCCVKSFGKAGPSPTTTADPRCAGTGGRTTPIAGGAVRGSCCVAAGTTTEKKKFASASSPGGAPGVGSVSKAAESTGWLACEPDDVVDAGSIVRVEEVRPCRVRARRRQRRRSAAPEAPSFSDSPSSSGWDHTDPILFILTSLLAPLRFARGARFTSPPPPPGASAFELASALGEKAENKQSKHTK